MQVACCLTCMTGHARSLISEGRRFQHTSIVLSDGLSKVF